ncbi:winged helix-turn-helix domain-containing protein [Microbulbifer bruguierae]|uniref:Winged helix-turn-helix domain-containing protein n=1 Tax=Microbulbifer bruguierae TaxID=3029061 RepID=A0ABY8N7Y0_9GAMM|nr:winged helix-turn-helix domain-containing protein [Microbulbifer bruguierae]WGL15000.1 winged helix-turn-helix domain-containing protein [Microbulbifer bruguierae]
MQYRFDKFVLDTAQLRLTADGNGIEVDARQLQLLALLIGNYPEYLERQQLLEQLWPNTVVSQWSLGRLVSDTRKLFREQGYAGALIQTLHGRGYRLSPELAEQLRSLPPADLPESGRGEVEPGAAYNSSESRSSTPVIPATTPVATQQASSTTAGISSPAADTPARAHWPLLAGMGLMVLLTALSVYLITARQIPDAGEPLVIGEASDVVGRVLWVDDHPDNNLDERRFFETQRVAVYLVTSTEDALTLLSMYRYDAVISDMGRGREPLAGFKLMERMRSKGDQTPFFLYTIMPSASQRALVQQRGGDGVAVTPEELYALVLPLFELTSPPRPDLQAP